MYNKNFVVVVKVNRKVLREIDSIVTIPFGNEYTILLKNLDSKTAVVNVDIDGQDVLDNSRLVIYGNSELELHGFLIGNDVKNKFKFIEKTEEISNHRGDRPDDGIIRVEYKFEKPIVCDWSWTYTKPVYYPWYPQYPWNPNAIYCNSSSDNISEGGSTISCGCSSFTLSSAQQDNDSDDGITVRGSDDVDQKFNNVFLNTLESESRVIVLKLRGTKSDKPMTVKDKIICDTCGRKSQAGVKWCYNCGTFLEW